MLLLPGSLPPNAATLKALCAGLGAHYDTAGYLRASVVESYGGSWSDAEREALGMTGDLGDGHKLAATTPCHEGRQCAIATPLHATLGLTDLTPLDPTLIALDEAESRALCEAADQHLSVDGVRLAFVDAHTWLVICTNQIKVLTERPDWIIGEPMRPNLPRGQDARLIERWMNELQMLLYAHPVNAAREQQGLPPINVVWLWGFGSTESLRSVGKTSFDHVVALRNGNVSAWQNAWQKLAPEILAADTIILGDSRPRLRLRASKPSTASRLTAFFQRKPTLEAVLATFQRQL